jgi:hypothetical protein
VSATLEPRTVDVKLGDFLNIMCPRYNTDNNNNNEYSINNNQPYAINSRQAEYHAIYMVSREEYETCRIAEIEHRQPVLKCDRPSENVKYTLYISRFSPIPEAIEFQPGNSYHFICKRRFKNFNLQCC